MLTPRNVILAALAVMLISLTWAVVSMLREPDSGGRAADTYGTRDDGQRGLYETMVELGLPVSRSLEPPGQSVPSDTTIVLWNPDGDLVSYEPRFLHDLGDWVRHGGRVVVTPPDDTSSEIEFEVDPEIPIKDASTTFWEALQLGDLAVTTSQSSAGFASTQSETTEGDDAEGTNPVVEPPRHVVIDVSAQGELAELAAEVQQLAALEGGMFMVSADAEAGDDALICRDASGVERTVVRQFAVGDGAVIVVGDHRLFSNRLLAKADNSVLAVRLLLGDRQQVQFNEFYHGLSVRGNPLWLLTRRGYALLAAAVLAVVVVVTWRSAVLLGPPLNSPESSRRTVAEYIDAMSRFLNRGRRTRQPLLQAVYAGTLRQIAAEHGLTQVREDADAIASVVARRNRDRADRLRAAAAAVDAVLAKHDKATEKETVHAFRQLQDCL